MLDFIGFINEGWEATNEKKLTMLDSFVYQYGYRDEVEVDGEMVENPVTKKEFANEKIRDYIVQTVNAYRKQEAEAVVEYEELDI